MATKKAGARAFATGLEESIMADLETLRQKSLKTGAAAAEILPASQVVVDERVRLKCIVPRCLRAGETPNCPPYAPDLELVKKAFSRFSWAILLKTNVEPIKDYDPKKDREQSFLFHQKTGEVVYEIEREAYKLGYHLAMGFGGGSCKDYLCRGLLCQSLDSGKCRFPLRSRPAMEAMGIDVFDLITKARWQAYPLLDEVDEVPCAISVGLVFVY
jgi:predicted metal-binding protein